jgi:thiamine biosynthesis lipoprotein
LKRADQKPCRSHRFRAMGSPCVLHLYAEPTERADEVAKLAIAEVERLEAKYSRYRDDSVTSRINRHAGRPDGVCVDSETAQLLDYAETAYRQSEGLFDITSGILRKAWNFKEKKLPTEGQLRALLERVGWQRARWCAPRLVLPEAGMEVDFGGYVKEYAADRVAQLCRDEGIRHGLVDLGGDLCVVGPHPDNSPWRVGIRHPRDPERAMACVPIHYGAIASSGDYERFMIVDGARYAHVLDPRTGWPVEGLSSVSVVAPHCLVAGTAATIAMLMGREAGPAWLDELGLPSLRMTCNGELSGALAPKHESLGERDRAAAAADLSPLA